MGGSCSSASVKIHDMSDSERRNALENLELEISKVEQDLEMKLLCLGSGEAGKSTLVSQLVFIHKGQIPDQDRISFISVLQNNAVVCMNCFVRAVEQYDYPLTEELNECARKVKDYGLPEYTKFSSDLVDAIQKLWASSSIKRAFERRHEYWHMEASAYFFENCHRFIDPGFIPNDTDVIMCRKRTTGVVTTEFNIGEVKWCVLDVGGQRNERKKWLNCFDKVKAILWLVNLADYNLILFEENSVNRLQEALVLFEQTLRLEKFPNTPVFLIFNKRDLFDEMIQKYPLSVHFPSYKEPDKGSDAATHALKFIENEFLKRVPPSKSAITRSFFIAAKHREEVEGAFNEIKKDLLDRSAAQIKAASEQLPNLLRKRDELRKQLLQIEEDEEADDN